MDELILDKVQTQISCPLWPLLREFQPHYAGEKAAVQNSNDHTSASNQGNGSNFKQQFHVQHNIFPKNQDE